MFQNWDIKRAFDTIRPKLRQAIREGDKERPEPALRAGAEAWKRFQANAVWLDMQDWLTERMIQHLMDLSKESDDSKRDALQASIAECSTFLFLPESMLQEALERSAGTSTQE